MFSLDSTYYLKNKKLDEFENKLLKFKSNWNCTNILNYLYNKFFPKNQNSVLPLSNIILDEFKFYYNSSYLTRKGSFLKHYYKCNNWSCKMKIIINENDNSKKVKGFNTINCKKSIQEKIDQFYINKLFVLSQTQKSF